MSSKFQQFKDFHYSKDLFVLPNVWNAKSALLFQQKNFPAIATSSAAVANSLGYEDGEEMCFNEYLFIIKRIASSVQIPLSVDIEMGYGKSNEEIVSNILKLIELDVAGINIEDSTIKNSNRTIQDPKKFAETIEYIKNKLEQKNLQLFINVRCDTFILNLQNKLEESIHRAKMYEAGGADGLFLPCINSEADIAEVVSHTKLPLNVMCIPGLPCFETLNQLGVKRVSMGPFLFNKIYNNIYELSNNIIKDKSFSSILS